MWLFFCYTIQLININLCTKFQNPKSSSCCEIFDRKKCLYVLCKSERRKKLKKEGKLRINILISNYTVHLAFLKVYTKFENTGSNRSLEMCDRNFHWRERKMNKKGNDKQYVAVLLLHNTTNQYQALYQISES